MDDLAESQKQPNARANQQLPTGRVLHAMRSAPGGLSSALAEEKGRVTWRCGALYAAKG